MKRAVTLAILGLVIACPKVGAQGVSVSDVTAYRELFLMTSRQTRASMLHLHSVGLPTAADQSIFEANIKDFRKKFDALVESYNTKAEAGLATEDEFWGPADALTYGTMTQLTIGLSPLGTRRLRTLIERFKSNIRPMGAISTTEHNHAALKPAAFHLGVPQGCIPQNSYNTTWSYSTDGTNFYLSTIVSGTGSMPPYCPHGNFSHSPTAVNSINGYYAQTNGSGSCPACYISAEVDNSQPLSSLAWEDFQASVQGKIQCTLAGVFYNLISLLHFQVEGANTTSQVLWNTKGVNGFGHAFYDAVSSCPQTSPPSKPDNPPDFPGPDIVFDTDPISTGWVRVEDICIRWAFWGNSFVGQPWFCANVPRTDSIIKYPQFSATAGQGQLCTFKDNGYEPPF